MAVTGGTKQQVDVAESERSKNLAPVPPRRSGIDRFDEAIVVTRTRAWIGLAAALAMVAGVIVWASLAQVSKTIPAVGVALAGGALAEAHSPGTGVVTSLDVPVGGHVTAGQTLGTVAEGNGHTAPIIARIGGQVVQINQGVGTHATVDATIVSIAQTSGPVSVRTFVPSNSALLLRVGTPVLMNFLGGVSVQGRVSEIGVVPLSAGDAASSLGSPALARVVGATGDSVPVMITPEREPESPFGGIAYANITFIYGQQHPISFVF